MLLKEVERRKILPSNYKRLIICGRVSQPSQNKLLPFQDEFGYEFAKRTFILFIPIYCHRFELVLINLTDTMKSFLVQI